MPSSLSARPESTAEAARENPFHGSEAAWATLLVSGVKSGLDSIATEVQAKLGEAWEWGIHAGYEQGYQAGTSDVRIKLTSAHERALADQEALARRTLSETEQRLRMEAESELRQAELRVRRETEQRLRGEFEADLRDAEQRTRREVELRLRDAFETELQQEGARVRRESERLLRGEFDAERERAVTQARRELEQQLRAEFEREGRGASEAAERREELEQAIRAEFEAERRELKRKISELKAKGTGGPDPEALEQARAEGYAQGLRDGARDTEGSAQVALERREAVDEAFQKGYVAGLASAEQEAKAAYQEGYQKGLSERPAGDAPKGGADLSPMRLDEAKRQAYQSGYEDGRSVGLAKGRRETESGMMQKLQEAARNGYREGLLDGKRLGGDGDRAWAFGIMHLPTGASGPEIKQRYKKLSMVLHPDQNPTLGDEYIKNLNRAREILES